MSDGLDMFCYQCSQTAKGTGCTVSGVTNCSKTAGQPDFHHERNQRIQLQRKRFRKK